VAGGAGEEGDAAATNGAPTDAGVPALACRTAAGRRSCRAGFGSCVGCSRFTRLFTLALPVVVPRLALGWGAGLGRRPFAPSRGGPRTTPLRSGSDPLGTDRSSRLWTPRRSPQRKRADPQKGNPLADPPRLGARTLAEASRPRKSGLGVNMGDRGAAKGRWEGTRHDLAVSDGGHVATGEALVQQRACTHAATGRGWASARGGACGGARASRSRCRATRRTRSLRRCPPWPGARG
jgi:hypothetical protein